MSENSPVCMAWDAPRRLAHLRPLHDDLKASMGKQRYVQLFKASPFGIRGAPPGTSKRLHAWTQRLAECVNENMIPPWLMMRIFMSLEAPSASFGNAHETPTYASMDLPDPFDAGFGMGNTAQQFEIGDSDEYSGDSDDDIVPTASVDRGSVVVISGDIDVPGQGSGGDLLEVNNSLRIPARSTIGDSSTLLDNSLPIPARSTIGDSSTLLD